MFAIKPLLHYNKCASFRNDPSNSSVAKSPVFKRACPLKRAFGENRPFFARFFVISPVYFLFFGH